MLAALAITVPVMATRADAGVDTQVDIYYSASPSAGNGVIGRVLHGTTTPDYTFLHGLTAAQALATDGTAVITHLNANGTTTEIFKRRGQTARGKGLVLQAGNSFGFRRDGTGALARREGIGHDHDMAHARVAGVGHHGVAVPVERRALEWDATGLPVPADVLVYTRNEWEEQERKGASLAREVVWVTGV